MFIFKSSEIILGIVLVLTIPLSCVGTPQATINFDYGDPRFKDLLDTCLDAENHKSEPGPEDVLHRQCSPWANRSCCTTETSLAAHYKNMYSFNWNHCDHIGVMSSGCRKHFVQDLCFYECSPNIGPWKVKVDMKIRKERFYKVPLCETDCNTWFEDCAEDFTCTDNWVTNMEWIKGEGNRCPVGSSCKTFRQIYGTAKYFCETVWDHSWEVTQNKDYCMRLWFDPSAGNPNDKVAKWKATEMIKRSRKNSSAAAFLDSAKYYIIVVSTLTVAFLKVFQ